MTTRRDLSLAWRVLRAEGLSGFAARGQDRLVALRRDRRFGVASRIDLATCGPPESLDLQPAPPVLNVLPTLPRPDRGGVEAQLLRRLQDEEALRSWALLYPQADGYRLEICAAGQSRAFLLTTAALPTSPLVLEDEPFAQAVQHAAALLGARAVHIEQPVGLPLRSIAQLDAAGLDLVLSLHDFGLFCPRPHLLEHPAGRFCHYSRDDDRCYRCLRQDWPVDTNFQGTRRAVAAALLRTAAAVIFPSAFLQRTYRDLLPGLDAKRQWIVAPPAPPPPPSLPPARARKGPLHAAYVGSVKAHKGAGLFADLVEKAAAEGLAIRWSVFGGGDPDLLDRLRGLRGVRLHGYYRAGTLAQQLAQAKVDVALLLSIVPESYGLTLDECRQAGVPALALDHGAVAERIREGGGGRLVTPERALDGLVEVLRSWDRQEEALSDRGAVPVFDAAGTVGSIYQSLGLIAS